MTGNGKTFLTPCCECCRFVAHTTNKDPALEWECRINPPVGDVDDARWWHVERHLICGSFESFDGRPWNRIVTCPRWIGDAPPVRMIPVYQYAADDKDGDK